MAVGLDHIKAATSASEVLELPDLTKLFWLVFGEKQVGKSTWASRFPKPFFLDIEHRLDSIATPAGVRPAQQKVHTWKEITDWTDGFIGTTPEQTGIETFIVDGIGVGYTMLAEAIMQGSKSTPKAQTLNDQDLGYAKGWIMASAKFADWFMNLRKLKEQGYGIVLTTHDRVVPFSNNGVEFDKRVPLIANDKDEKYGWTAVRAFPDMVVYAHKMRTQGGIVHMAQLRGNDVVEAGCVTPPSGINLPDVIPFTFQSFRDAWDRTEVTS